MASSPRLRGALVGCGNVARHHLRAWRAVEGAEIVALCERDPARLEAARSLVPGASGHADFEALLQSRDLDFVEICTGPESHPALVHQAAARGLAVLCQKPASATRDELVAMIRDCDDAGVRLMIHENWRFRPWNRALRAAIDRGDVGRPIRLRMAHRDTRALRADGFSEQPFLATRSRLILLEMGCHLVDLARFLFGEVGDVSATMGRLGTGHPGEDVATLSLRFVSGALGLLDMSWCAPADPVYTRAEWALNETVVEGTQGTLSVQADGSLRRLDLSGHPRSIHVPLPEADAVYVDAFRAAQQHFVDGLRDGASFETDGRDTLRTMDVVWAGYRSAETGAAVSLNTVQSSEGA